MKFTWQKPKNEIAKEALNLPDGLEFLAQESQRLMDPYVPAKNLILSQDVTISQDGKMGIVEYNSPYAHYQYTGKLYVDQKTGKAAFYNGERFWSRPGVAKVPTSKELSYSKSRHPLAQAQWDKAINLTKKRELAEAYEKYLRK